MSSGESYDEQVQAIRVSNQPLLDGFHGWLRQASNATEMQTCISMARIVLHDATVESARVHASADRNRRL